MRRALALVMLCLFTNEVLAQTIKPTEAFQYEGQVVVVRGVVDEVHTSGRNDTFLDLGGKYPNQAFTGVIFSESSDIFPGVHSLEGRTVRVSGSVQIYRGKPEIILRSPDQLAVE